MPEKDLCIRNVGMEVLNSVGSTGSCDSMESISSNHSALSGDNYDHLSAEERECLMFLEETIDSLENEADSGLSNDESENTENIPSLLQPEPIGIRPDYEKTKSVNHPRTENIANEQDTVNFNKPALPKQGYHSFPRIIQVPKEETTKHSTEETLNSRIHPGNALDIKHKSLSSLNYTEIVELPLQDLHLLPPPEPFRDLQNVEKEHYVSIPAEPLEVQLEKSSIASAQPVEQPEAAHSGHSNVKGTTSLIFPRPILQKTVVTGLEESPNPLVEKGDGNVKQGPPTAPKPRKLPPHIIIKPSSGVIATNLDPQQRPRAFSAHERNTDKSIESINTKLSHSKEQERARREALQKLGLMQEKNEAQRTTSVKPPTVFRAAEISISQSIVGPGHKDSYGNRISINQQEKADVLGTSPTQHCFQGSPKSVDIGPRNEALINKPKSRFIENPYEPQSGTGTLKQAESCKHESTSSGVKIDIHRNRLSLKGSSLEKSDETLTRIFQPSKEAHSIKTDNLRNPPPVSLHTKDKGGEVLAQLVTDNSASNAKNDEIRSLKINAHEKDLSGPASYHVSARGIEHVTEKKQQNITKVGSLENVNTSPGKSINFPRPIDTAVPQSVSEVVLREGKGKTVVDSSQRHSTHFDHSDEPFLRLPQSTVPGLRQINIKSNTLERSGIGISSSLPSSDNQSQKGGNSFFKKPMFSANFLRNNRPRPASLGTGKDFASLEEQTTDAEKGDSRRLLFFRNSRTPAPVTSVKITPKGSNDEHRREALMKLGILKE
ncbi:hypothetical protein XENTR_v10005530 [Xenopus tropicalis]|uniref:Chromosome 1 open reading frame 116 n=1 Tax=Xenopus tropicalis TaxID=8364 RepID=F7ECY2_XENTR|nr:specifically androgen-regulated gene protein [Xenopus tropicalis]XP_012811630.1 specifically androgen-regulated gene protein isoform X1 [Xenopus tropicalis]AAI28653.1 LOC100036700 protein [Xenopus tropicalis]KAE8623180.1 hypothetical protein XENTR_v10005530 [Xenopus tropicalis]KAE8623181.1 hypothetical protein XENTR_v10005530 [Xenopus tropicalis]|eukprot:NP_001090718.1 specifically androgen-regulated gene protein [Xenopus tropicalis]